MTPAEHWALWRSDPRATPFQSPAWLDAWWTHLGGGERIDLEVRADCDRSGSPLPFRGGAGGGASEPGAALVSTPHPNPVSGEQRPALFRSGRGPDRPETPEGEGLRRFDLIANHSHSSGRLVAALPMFVWRDGGVRRLVPVGAGHSDYSDALVDPHASVAGLWAELAAVAERWDEVLLPDLRPDSPLLGPVPDGWIATDEPGEVCPVLTLPREGPLLPALTKSQRRKVVHDRHRAAHAGGAAETIVGPEGIAEALDALFALHAARWQAAGEPGVLADPRVQAFHRAAAPALAEAGLLRLATVRFDNRIVAVLLGLVDGRRGYSYINGVANDVLGQSFGSMAFATVIERAVADGAAEFHFLRGEEPYKYQWGAQPTRTVRRTIRRR